MPRQDGGGLLPHETVSDGAESPVISRKADFSHPIKVRRRACTQNEASKSHKRAGAPNRDQAVVPDDSATTVPAGQTLRHRRRGNPSSSLARGELKPIIKVPGSPIRRVPFGHRPVRAVV